MVTGACRDPVWTSPAQTTDLNQPATVAREVPPALTSGDWCSGLIYGANGVSAFTFGYDPLSMAGGLLTYTEDGLYSGTLNTSGQGVVEIPSRCLTRFGAEPTCDELSLSLMAFAAIKPSRPARRCSDSASEPSACDFFKSYENISCAAGAQGGCTCSYAVSYSGSVGGTWEGTAGVLTHSDNLRTLPSKADFCVAASGTVMTLWGHNSGFLFDEAGLRELTLQRTQ
jgi:hypothetical protein